jgi:hypothetical protein
MTLVNKLKYVYIYTYIIHIVDIRPMLTNKHNNTFAANAKTICCELMLLMLITDIIVFPSWKNHIDMLQ